MNTIQSRMGSTKNAPNIHPNSDASSTIERAVQLWEQQKDKDGNLNKPYQAGHGETNIRSTTKKASDQKKDRKAE